MFPGIGIWLSCISATTCVATDDHDRRDGNLVKKFSDELKGCCSSGPWLCHDAISVSATVSPFTRLPLWHIDDLCRLGVGHGCSQDGDLDGG